MEIQSELLRGHPIFSPRNPMDVSLELSLNNLPNFKSSRSSAGPFDQASSSHGIGRRNIMALRDSDIILAIGNEIRIASLTDAKTVGLHRRSYKTLHTPNLDFNIRQITVNPNGKLLAVAGVYQVAVVSLPRTGYSNLVTSKVDCRTIQVGQFHHATTSAAPISKIEWHPWGKSACTLLVMTTDGAFREYDISMDPEEPQQTLSFMPERSRTSSYKGDSSAREVTSFCLGKGKADWGPLTVYALTKSGDIWAICPFLPSNAVVPSAYIHALEYFVRAKEELAAQPSPHSSPSTSHSHHEPSLSTVYAHQLKYVVSLSKQLPPTPSTLFPAPSRPVPISAPLTVKARPIRQGPFLFQPAPRELDQGAGGDATDLVYLSVEGTSPLHSEEDDNGERLGVLAVSYSDGKVDICLDVEKIEAMWESDHVSTVESPVSELPMVAVYETIDLGLVSMLSDLAASEPSSWLESPKRSKTLLDILQVNYPVFVPDPIYNDTLYLYHAFGVHCLNMSRWLRPLANSLRSDADERLRDLIEQSIGSEVINMMDTFSTQSRSSLPVTSVFLPSDVYLSYSLFAVTSSLDIYSFELALRVDSTIDLSDQSQHSETPLSLPRSISETIPGVEASDRTLVSLLSKEPYEPPAAVSPAATSALKKLAQQSSALPRGEITITPETLRQFATVVQNFQSHIRDIYVALRDMQARLMIQEQEFLRQQGKYLEIVARSERLKGPEQERIRQRFERATAEQKRLLGKSDKILQRLMDTSSPVLNDHEKRWFAELKRMTVDVFGEGSYDSASLKARTDTLSRKLEYHLPNLKELAQWEEQQRKEAAQNPVALGRGQELRLMMRLGEHKKTLSDAVQNIGQLAASMNVVLEDHPKLE